MEISRDPAPIERRKNLRIPVVVPVDLNRGRKGTRAETVNISVDGAFIATGEVFQPGASLEVTFHLPNEELSTTHGRVLYTLTDAHVSDLPTGIGVFFPDDEAFGPVWQHAQRNGQPH